MDLSNAYNLHTLASVLGCSAKQLGFYLYRRSISAQYKKFDIPKRRGGLLYIDWGDSPRAWVQRRTDKPITELHRVFKEPEFPGFSKFVKRLSEIESLPSDWVAILRSTRGVYLLTCPETKEQYVGKASGSDGFWGRWQDYLRDGHGGNIRLQCRASDYQVSILETVGNAVSDRELDALEALWKQKLQSRDMGLNAN
jgi:hypothetical protein